MLVVIALVATCSAISAGAVLLRTSDADGISQALADAGIGASVAFPWQPSLDEQYPAAGECARCHPTQTAEWRGSAHARSATDPLVHASVCGRCHAPLGTQFDELYQLNLYDQTPMQGVPESAAEGITCVTCHAQAHTPDEQLLTFLPEWPNWRSTDLALEILPFDPTRGTFGAGAADGAADPAAEPADDPADGAADSPADPTAGAADDPADGAANSAADDPEPVPNESHTSVLDADLTSSELCRPCHDVVVDKAPLAPHCGLGMSQSRVALLTTYAEWAASPYAAPDETGETCQSCHMPLHEAAGPAAIAPSGTEYDRPLPDRQLANHTITGVSSEYLTTGPSVENQEERVAARVKDAAAIELHVPLTATVGAPLDISVTMTNTGAGHDLPTGFAYWSEAWLELTVTDADGRVLLESGDVDHEGWLRDEFNPRVIDGTMAYDESLVSLRARLVTVGPNQARWQHEDGTLRIPYDEVPRNLNGTPIIGPDGDIALAISRQVHPDDPLPVAGYSLQEGYYLRHADTVVRNGIPAKASRVARFSAQVEPSTRGPVSVSARMLIRSLWPWMLQQQQELPEPRPRPTIYEIATAQATVPVSEP